MQHRAPRPRVGRSHSNWRLAAWLILVQPLKSLPDSTCGLPLPSRQVKVQPWAAWAIRARVARRTATIDFIFFFLGWFVRRISVLVELSVWCCPLSARAICSLPKLVQWISQGCRKASTAFFGGFICALAGVADAARRCEMLLSHRILSGRASRFYILSSPFFLPLVVPPSHPLHHLSQQLSARAWSSQLSSCTFLEPLLASVFSSCARHVDGVGNLRKHIRAI